MATEVTPRSAIGSTPTAGSAARWSLLAICLAGSLSCRDRSESNPQPRSASSPASAPSAPVARVPSAPTVACLEPELFAPGQRHPTAVYAIEGAIMVVEGVHVGRIRGDGVDWIGSVPRQMSAETGETVVSSVSGRWPDSVGAITYQSNYSLYPTFFPLTWKSPGFVLGPGGSTASIHGVFRIGDSLLVMGSSTLLGYQIVHTHGPKLTRRFLTEQQVGCEREDRTRATIFVPAVRSHMVESAPAGAVVSVGDTCRLQNGELAAEVWDQEGASRFVDLSRFWKKGRRLEHVRSMLKGQGDELFIFKSSMDPIVHYRDGNFEAVPELGGPVWHAFASPSGKLHVSNGRDIYRLDGGDWVPVARLSASAADAGERLESPSAPSSWTARRSGHRIVIRSTDCVRRPPEHPRARKFPSRGSAAAARASCAAPFVYLHEVSGSTPDNYDFPKTRKALSTFPEVAAVTLIEARDDGSRHVGVKVTSAAQGEALIAHLRGSMKDEDPRLTCYYPWSFKTIAINRSSVGRSDGGA